MFTSGYQVLTVPRYGYEVLDPAILLVMFLVNRFL